MFPHFRMLRALTHPARHERSGRRCTIPGLVLGACRGAHWGTLIVAVPGMALLMLLVVGSLVPALAVMCLLLLVQLPSYWTLRWMAPPASAGDDATR